MWNKYGKTQIESWVFGFSLIFDFSVYLKNSSRITFPPSGGGPCSRSLRCSKEQGGRAGGRYGRPAGRYVHITQMLDCLPSILCIWSCRSMSQILSIYIFEVFDQHGHFVKKRIVFQTTTFGCTQYRTCTFWHLKDLEHGPPPEGGNVILDEFFK